MIQVNRATTALVVTDPQNDFLATTGVFWDAVKESVIENNTIENIETMFQAAKEGGIPVFISPHYYYPWDHDWKFSGTVEKLMHDVGMYDRPNPLDLTGFEGSGADFLDRYKPYIHDGETVVANPHKVYGPENNDLLLQLRKRGIDSVYLTTALAMNVKLVSAAAYPSPSSGVLAAAVASFTTVTSNPCSSISRRCASVHRFADMPHRVGC